MHRGTISIALYCTRNSIAATNFLLNDFVELFENGTRLVWVIHPDEQYVLVYHSPSPDRLLRLADSLDGEDVVPGFSLAIAELFQELDF